jgi:Aminopeptidase I zinc metalloprotease (M18)
MLSISTRMRLLLYTSLLALVTTGVLNLFCHGLAASSAAEPARLPPLMTSSLRSTMMQKYMPLAQKAMEYLDASSDPFHAVQTSVDLLKAAGFEPWSSSDNAAAAPPALKAGGKYYFTKNKSTLIAFAVGKRYKAGNGLKIIAGHTDSPNLRVKTRSQRGGSSPSSAVGGCLQIGVECYGGGLWHVRCGTVYCHVIVLELFLISNAKHHTTHIFPRLCRSSRPGLIETWACRDASLYDPYHPHPQQQMAAAVLEKQRLNNA